MQTKNIFYLVGLMLLVTSCFKDVTIDVDEQESVLVLNGWLKAGETPKVSVFASKPILQKGEIRQINTAVVNLYENDQLVGLMTRNEQSYYTLDGLTIKPGYKYKITVEYPSYPDLEASVTVPLMLNPDEITIEHRTKQVNDGYGTYSESEISLQFKDEKTSEDYYGLAVSSYDLYYDKEYGEDTVYNSYTYGGLESADPTVDEIYYNYNSMIGIRDDLFNGESYSNVFRSYNDLRYYEYEDEYSYTKSGSSVVFYQFSEALYKYLLSLENNRYPEAFVEPSQVYSNVKGGYGILGASNELNIEIDEERTDFYY
jgi:hypothetical protein